jgi:hypothetical protein
MESRSDKPRTSEGCCELCAGGSSEAVGESMS